MNDKLLIKKGNDAKIIYNDSIELSVHSFELKYYLSGKLYLSFDIKKQNTQSIDTFQKIEFKGKTEDNFSFCIDITKDFNENPAHLKFYSVSNKIQIFNPLFLERHVESRKTIIKQYLTNFLFDYNSIDSNEFEIEIKRTKFIFRNISEYKESKDIINTLYLPQITGYCEIELQDNYGEVKKIIRNVLELISYSQRQFVQIPYEEIVNENGEIIKIRLFPQVLRQARSGFTVVEATLLYEPDQSIKKFVEDSYENYILWKDRIKLDYSLTYYLLGFIPQQGEVEYILVFTAIESLIRHYEDYFLKETKTNLDDIKKEQYIERLNSKKLNLNLTENQINSMIHKGKFYPKTLDFNQSLGILYSGKISSKFKNEAFGIGLERDVFDCKASSIRNDLIHKGEFKDYSDLSQISQDTKNIVFMFDKIFLTILGYTGYFRDYRNIEKWIKI